jgi:hypothetical protein
MPPRDYGGIEIVEAPGRREWEDTLAGLEGAHPLQTWVWGAGQQAEGERVVRLFARRDGAVVGMAQVFERRVTALGPRVAWIPRGPAWNPEAVNRQELALAFGRDLRRRGFRAVVGNAYAGGMSWRWRVPWQRAAQTFWVDLTRDTCDLDAALGWHWRQNRNYFLRKGGTVARDLSPAALGDVLRLHAAGARRKRFKPVLTAEMLAAMEYAASRQPTPCVTLDVFRSMFSGRCAAAVLMLRVGRTAHPIAGGFDYELRKTRPNEAGLWAAFEHFKNAGVRRLDVEGGAGTGSANSSGVSEYKRRIGGKLVDLPPLTFDVLV